MKSLFRIGSAVILFTAMVSGLGCKKSEEPMATTPAFQVCLSVDPNLGQYLQTKMVVPFIFSQMILKGGIIARVNVSYTGLFSMLPISPPRW